MSTVTQDLDGREALEHAVVLAAHLAASHPAARAWVAWSPNAPAGRRLVLMVEAEGRGVTRWHLRDELYPLLKDLPLGGPQIDAIDQADGATGAGS